ncbi:MAG: aspartate--tRNA ligase [Alphaproteobacteria bacterium TMED93]|nr:MAG: aspartate--tRNA ligase [Alphaproteobacteria bacterium TMED93]
MHHYRTHTCGELTEININSEVKLSGWIHSKRDHGGLLFIDLRDQFGITQIVIDKNNKVFTLLEHLKVESVIKVLGKVIARSKETANKKIITGDIEVLINEVDILSVSNVLPMQVAGNENYGDEIRLKNRFLDLRREKVKKNIILRSEVISFIRNKMIENGFQEFQTPILTAASPEGARDFLVPSRIHRGKFYALPQAPQQFKQLIMVSGFDKYFQIAPCFRDEDARADRSPGEFYQLDIEMAFVEQDDIFTLLESVLTQTFKKFSEKKIVEVPFPKITYNDSLQKYGTDKPDLRNPLKIKDYTDFFKSDSINLNIFKNIINKGGVMKVIVAPTGKDKPRSFFDKLNNWAKEEGASGLGYMSFNKEDVGLIGKGPIAKNIDIELQKKLISDLSIKEDDGVFFICDEASQAIKFSGKVRTKLAEELNLIKDDKFMFCWIVDFPMYEIDDNTKNINFSHNPFSMPQGGLDALKNKDPLEIKAYQYDLVCNGIELSSGAIRNHKPEIMKKAFEIAGYSEEVIKKEFPALYYAFQFGPPPHGGIAPGLDRIVMLIADEKNIRDITMFPMNQKAEDLLMGAPNIVNQGQLKELNINLIEENE